MEFAKAMAHATSAQKDSGEDGDIEPTLTPFSLKKDGVHMHAKPAENGRSPSSQKEICNQSGRRQAIPAAMRQELVRRFG